MRILLACEFFHPSVGGVQEVMRQLGERLAAGGHEVTVATTYLPERKSRSIGGVAVREFKVAGNLVRGMQGDVEGYRHFVLRQDYDVLLIKAAQQWTFDALIPVLGDIRKPKIFIPCGFSGMSDPLYAEYFRAMPGWLREFDRLIFYASRYRDIDMARRHGLENIRIVPNGADEREFGVERDPRFRSRHGIPEDAFVVMTVGSLTGYKGHAELAAAFDRCDFGARPAFLLLIGNRPGRPARGLEAARQVYRLGGLARVAKWLLRPNPARSAEKTVRDIVARINAAKGRKAMLAELPRAEVIQAYLNSDLFVFASKIEYSPLVLFEAAAAGLPFLSVPVGNASEIAAWTGGGVICEAEVDAAGYTQARPEKLAQEIERLAQQPELLATLSAHGRRAWRERFSWRTIFLGYEKILEECVDEMPA